MIKDLIGKLKETGIVERGNFSLSGGGESDFYINIKKAYGDAEILGEIAHEMYSRMPNDINCVAGMGHGGLPLATAISLIGNLNLTLIRDEEKSHGLSGVIEGYIPSKEDVVAVVDDVFTTGKSIRKIIDIVSKTGALVYGACVVVKRGNGDLDFPLDYLLKAEELL